MRVFPFDWTGIAENLNLMLFTWYKMLFFHIWNWLMVTSVLTLNLAIITKENL